MKFIKYAVGLVIALSVIPLVVVTVNNLDQQTKLTTVEFEVVNVESNTIFFDENTYNNIHALAMVDEGLVINLITVKLNDIELTEVDLNFSNDKYSFSNSNATDWDDLDELNQATSSGYSATIDDKWEMTFEVPRPLPPLVKLLVGFAPLLFVGGILLFMLNKRKLD